MASINGRDRLNNLEGLKDSGNYPKRILDLATSLGALKYGDFILTSGKKSKYYFRCRVRRDTSRQTPLQFSTDNVNRKLIRPRT